MDSLPPHLTPPDPAPDPRSGAGIGSNDKPTTSGEIEESNGQAAPQSGVAPIVEPDSIIHIPCPACEKVRGAEVLPCCMVGFAPRFAAFVVDLAVIAMLATIFTLGGMIALEYGAGSHPELPQLVNDAETNAPLLLISLVLASMTYFTYYHGATGQTAGKLLLGLRVVCEDGDRLGYRRALARWLGYFISCAFFNLGFLWIILDRKKQAWHDKMVGSLVIWS